MIVKEWVCLAHGFFDSAEPLCPYGCSGEGMIERVFRTAPAIQSQGYRNMNATFAALAAEHGVTDLNQRGGDGMRRVDYATAKRMHDQVQQLGIGLKSGRNINDLFAPVNSVSLPAMGQSALQAGPGGRMMTPIGDSGVVFEPPRAVQAAGRPFDGRNAGTPEE